MSQKKLTIQVIESLEKKEFDELVKLYLKHEFNFKKIIITDGKDDIGLDIKVFDDEKSRKIQYQLTTQKSKTTPEKNGFNKKLTEDLEKAKLNNEEYGYSNKLLFFYSYSLTNKQIRSYEKIADKEYNIDLEIIDANRLSDEIEDIKIMSDYIFEIIGVSKNGNINTSINENMIYDLISFGRPSEFKQQIIEAFILQMFYIDNHLSLENIKTEIESKFKLSSDNDFYIKIIGTLLTDKKITKNKSDNTYSITEETLKEIREKNNAFLLERGLFKNYVLNILKKYKQEDFVEDYLIKLEELYTNNFDKDLEEISTSKESYLLSNIYSEFSAFIKEKLKNDYDQNEFAINLLQLCHRNKFIQKISASNVYIDKINDRSLQRYLNVTKKIFIDTSIALYSLCYYFKPHSEYNNFQYNTSKKLNDFIVKENITLYISERYIWEISNHFKDAFRLIPFSDIISNQKLGLSKNVFYNFFLYLKNNENYECSFSTFINEFGIKEDSSNESYNSHIKKFLTSLRIETQVIEKEYDIYELNELTNKVLRKRYKVKTNFAKNCDSIMFAYLADNDVDVHQLEPIFLTWDRSLQELYTDYISLYPDSQNWLNITPNKYLDSNSLLKFSLDNETLTDNLIALISDEIINNTHSLIDSLALILNPNDEVGLEFANKLAKMREEEINKIANLEIHIPDNYEGDAILDDVVFNITEHYKIKDDFSSFKDLFTNKNLIEKILELIKNSIKDIYDKNEISDEIFNEFDYLIKENKSI